MKNNKADLIIDRLIAAIQFTTILPFGKPGTYDPRGMILFFPVVGIILGTFVSMFDQAALLVWPKPVVSVLDVVFLIILTGAFHIDGLGDSADGLFGHRPKDKVLSIMKDSRIGVMGLVAILCVLSVKCCGLAGIDAHRSLLLIIIPAYARSGMLFGIFFLKYGRPEGTGYDLFKNPMKPADFLGCLIPLGLSVFMGWKGLWLNLIFIAITGSLMFYYKKRLGCITGDMLGAMEEVTEAVLFLLMSLSIII